MEEIVRQIVEDIASKYLENYPIESVTKLFDSLINLKTSFKESLLKTSTPQDVENLFHEASGILSVYAGTGSVSIDNALISAIKTAAFDHAHGTVVIDDSVVSAPKLVTGGGDGATGTTTIRGSTLKSSGTSIRMGKNASIRMSGGASITQN